MPVDHERAFLAALQSLGAKEKVLPSLDAETTTEVETVSRDSAAPSLEAPEPPASVTLQNIWRHPDAHPIALELLMLRQYGPEWLGWEAETLQALVPEDFKTPSLSALNLAKLQACKVLHLVDSFWAHWEVFLACLMPFNNEFPDFTMMQVPTAAQCLVACDIAARIRTDVEFSGEIRTYVGQVFQHDGIFLSLPPAEFAIVTVPESIQREELERRWVEVRVSNQPPRGDTVLDEQLRRLLIINTFLEESRTRLQQQLRLHV